LGFDGSARVGVSEGEGEVLAGASGSLSSLDAKRKKTSIKGFLKLLDIQREIPSRSPPSPWSAKKKKKREKRMVWGLGFA
jgi:hypothetical protein